MSGCKSRQPASESEPAARDVDPVSVLDIFWIDRFTVNGGSKVNGFGSLFSVNYACQVNIAQASIVTHPARFHDRLVHRRWAIKINFTRLISKSGYDHGRRTTLQC